MRRSCVKFVGRSVSHLVGRCVGARHNCWPSGNCKKSLCSVQFFDNRFHGIVLGDIDSDSVSSGLAQ
jgi:hypothetical protein